MSSVHNKVEEELMLKRLQEILLSQDRAEIERLRETLEDRQKLSEKIDPIVEQHIDFLKNNFPVEFQKKIDQQITEKLAASQEDILNVIYPVLGKMIKKFIAQQFQLLKDTIDQSVKATFSSKGIFGRIKSSIFGVKESDIILSNLDKPEIKEIFIIERDSGLLLGSASVQQTLDQEVVAGMLTAIKAFVEDAFMGGEQSLDMIEYDTHKIFLQNFHTYYMAIALSGSVSTAEKNKITTMIGDFAEQSSLQKHSKPSEEGFDLISKELDHFFFQTNNPLHD